MNQLKVGIRLESEHRPTYRYIQNYLKRKKRLPPQRLVFKHIAQNHLKEHKNYYSKLKKAKL